MRRVADQRDPAKGPLIERIAIHHRIFEAAVGRLDHCRHVHPTELPVGKLRQEINQIAGAVPILPPPGMVRMELAFGDPVDYRLAPLLRLAGDRVGDKLLELVPGHDH